MATQFRKFIDGIRVVPKSTDLASQTGDLEVDSVTGKLEYFQLLDKSPVVTETHQATLSNKTLDTPVVNTSITGGSSSSLTIQSATNRDLVLQSQGTGVVTISSSSSDGVQIEDLKIHNNTLTGGSASDLTIQSNTNTDLVLQSQGTGEVIIESSGTMGVVIEDVAISNALISASNLTIQSNTDTNLTLSAEGTGSVLIEDIEIVGNSITGGASTLSISSPPDFGISVTSLGTGGVSISSNDSGDITITSGDSSSSINIDDLIVKNNTITSLVGNNLELSAGGQNIVLSASTIDVNSRIAFDRASDATSIGTALPQKTKSFVDLTGSISTIDTIQAGFDGQFLVLSNRSGSAKTINNEIGTPTNDRILTGTGAALTLEDKASIILVYNETEQRWMVVGGSGGGSESTIDGVAGEAITTGDSVYLSNLDNKFYKVDAGSDSEIEYIGVSLDTVGLNGAPRIQTSGEVTVPSASIVGGAFTIGKPVYIDPSLPGKYTSTVPTSAGQWIIQAGIATSAVKMVINGAGSATAVKITSETDQFVYANVASVSTTQTLSNGNSIVLATGGVGGITLTLPSPTAGKIFNIKKVDSGVGTITLSPPSGTIDGAASKVITSQYDSLTITSDGTNFFII